MAIGTGVVVTGLGAFALILVALAKSSSAKPSAGGGGGGSGGSTPLDKMTCGDALGLLEGGGGGALAAPAKALLAQPVTPATAESAKKMAQVFRDGAASGEFKEPYSGAMRVVATCLDNYAKGLPGGGGPSTVLTDQDGVPVTPDGGPAKKGIASNPNFQWLHVVEAGDTAGKIAALYFGSAGWSRYRELVRNNPTEHYSGRSMGIVGDYNNPNTPTAGTYNWTSLRPGDRLKIPKSWNRWVDQEGYRRGDPSPFPNA